MENNKLIKSEQGIFSKIVRKIKLLFFKNKEVQNAEEEKIKNIQANIKEELKVEVENDKSYQKEQFMKEISDNPDLLENFSIERLEKIKEYYKESINKKQEILQNMKKV